MGCSSHVAKTLTRRARAVVVIASVTLLAFAGRRDMQSLAWVLEGSIVPCLWPACRVAFALKYAKKDAEKTECLAWPGLAKAKVSYRLVRLPPVLCHYAITTCWPWHLALGRNEMLGRAWSGGGLWSRS